MEELRQLNEYVGSTGMSREMYIRRLITNITPVVIPPIEYFEMIREIRRVGNNMRQVAQKAYSLGFIDAPLYEKNANKILRICDELNVICIPVKGARHNGIRKNQAGQKSS